MSDKCFRKCISYPGAELDSREQVGTIFNIPATLSEFIDVHAHVLFNIKKTKR